MYTHIGIQAASPIGGGRGPLDHLHAITSKLIPRLAQLQPCFINFNLLSRPSSTNPYPFTRILIESTAKSWKAYVEHEFVVQLGKGILDKQRFVHFIK